jgi:hypothetical protein
VCRRFGNDLKAAQEVFFLDLDKIGAEIEAFQRYGDLEQSDQVCCVRVGA